MMKKTLLIVFSFLALTSCQRGCASFERKMQNAERDYEVIMYSGGDTVFYDNFRGVINISKESNGIYYFKGDELIELSGDYVIKSK